MAPLLTKFGNWPLDSHKMDLLLGVQFWKNKKSLTEFFLWTRLAGPFTQYVKGVCLLENWKTEHLFKYRGKMKAPCLRELDDRNKSVQNIKLFRSKSL